MHPVAAGPAAVEAGRQRGGEALAVQGGGAEVPDPDQVPATGVLGRAGLGHQKQSRPGVKGPSGRYHSHAKSVRQTIERAGISKKTPLTACKLLFTNAVTAIVTSCPPPSPAPAPAPPTRPAPSPR